MVAGLGGQTARLVFGAAKASLPIGWCTLHVAPLIGPVLPIPLGGAGPGTGSANLSLTVPASAAGATFLMQAFLTDPNTTIGYSASNGLELRVE